MKYIKKKLTIDKIKIEDIAKKFSTPTYCYSYTQLKKNINNFKKILILFLL
jgi:diaminopimelate decarboxylase